MRISRVVWGVALAAALGPAGMAAAQNDPVSPPTPGQITHRCVHAIGEAKEQGLKAMARSCEETVQLIRKLDEAGAPNELILRAGHRGIERVHVIARHTAGRINAIAEDCLRALRRIGAPWPFAQIINNARREALSMIPQAVERAANKIRGAVQAAIGNASPAPGG